MSLEGRLLGHYRLQQLIGSGGMGEIYLAQDTHIPRMIAIKVMRTDAGISGTGEELQGAERLFEREMKAISQLDHPHILPIFDYGTEPIANFTVTYLAMPYRPEGSLQDWLKRQNSTAPLDPHKVIYLVSQAADALQHAHDRHIIHQDIKPANFLVRERHSAVDVPDVLLADFGIAKFLDVTSSVSQQARGTPTYMAPEQWDGQPVPASDQYSLAIMAFLLLTGRPPFQGTLGQVMRQHFTAAPPQPSTLNPRLPPAVDAVFSRAMAKQPEARFPSVLLFAQALQQAFQAGASQFAPLQFATINSSATFSASSPSFSAPSIQQMPSQHSIRTASFQAQQPLSAQSRRSRALKPLLIVAALLIVLTSSGFAIFFAFNKPSTSSLPFTATAQPNLGLTATTQIRAQATATVHSLQAATATTVANDPYLHGKGKLLADDSLSTPGLWSMHESGSWGGTCLFKDGAYQVIEGVATRAYGCEANNGSLQASNFIYEVQVSILSGDCGGLRFRYNRNTNAGYIFRICHDGNIILSCTRLNVPTVILFGAVSPAVHSNYHEKNILAVMAKGRELRLYVNKQPIVTISDNTISRGAFSLDVQATTRSTTIAFNNAKIWQL
jgi:serine/threonine protein kinase